MNKNKVVRFIISVFVLSIGIVFAGCSENISEKDKEVKYFKKLPSNFTKEDKPLICVNRLNLEYNDNATSKGFRFHVLSKKALSTDDVKVKIDVKNTYTLIAGEQTEIKGKFPDYVCLQYNDINWKKLNELETSMNEKDIEEFQKIQNDINEEYKRLNEDEFPSFYDNEFFVQFTFKSAVPKDESFEKVEFIIQDKSYLIDIGKVYFNNQKKKDQIADYGKYNLEFDGVGTMGWDIVQRGDGVITLPELAMTAKKNVKIKNFKLDNKLNKLSIEEANINIQSDDETINQQWKPGQEVSIPAGAKVSLDIKIKDEDYVKQLAYAVNIYLILEYEDNGKNYIARNSILCESSFESQILYAMYKDKVDMNSYFMDYLKE